MFFVLLSVTVHVADLFHQTFLNLFSELFLFYLWQQFLVVNFAFNLLYSTIYTKYIIFAVPSTLLLATKLILLGSFGELLSIFLGVSGNLLLHFSNSIFALFKTLSCSAKIYFFCSLLWSVMSFFVFEIIFFSRYIALKNFIWSSEEMMTLLALPSK